jgi:hypothetical protein
MFDPDDLSSIAAIIRAVTAFLKELREWRCSEKPMKVIYAGIAVLGILAIINFWLVIFGEPRNLPQSSWTHMGTGD